MNQDNQKHHAQATNPFLRDFLSKVLSYNQKNSMRTLNEKFKTFKLSHDVEIKTLPTPEEVSSVIESNFSKYFFFIYIFENMLIKFFFYI